MKYIAPDKIFYHPDRLKAWINDDQVKPITAEIHLSNRCNNACSYCGQKQNHKNENMSLENIKLLRKFMDNVGIKACYFSGGGESTLNKDLFTAIDELKNIELGMITNGLVMPDELIKRYVNDFRWVRISLDAADDQTYFNIRGTHSFDTVKNNIKKLIIAKKEIKSDTVVGIQIVVNEHNYDELFFITAELLKMFSDIDYINIRPIEMKINEEPYTQKQLEIIKADITFLKNMENNINIKSSNKIIISEKWQDIFNANKSFGFSTCHSGEFIVTITADGDIYQCCHVTHLDDYRITNICDYENYFYCREKTFKFLKNKGFNSNICPLGCRGSGINKSIESMIKEKHSNFL